MKTIKNLQKLAFFVLVGFSLSVFFACSGDDEDEPIKLSTGVLVNGHEAVDLGLSVRWATCNVGADFPEQFGDYYAWGDTCTKSEYSRTNCITHGMNLGDISGNPQYDVASAKWESGWRIPTAEEFKELVEKCNWSWITYNGHKGNKIIGPNGNCIFLPAAGAYRDSVVINCGGLGVYQSSSPYENDSVRSYICTISVSETFDRVNWGSRYSGNSVRPVID